MEVFDAAELWSRDQIEHTQLTRLKATVAMCARASFIAAVWMKPV